jgi:chromosome segregation ATPase
MNLFTSSLTTSSCSDVASLTDQLHILQSNICNIGELKTQHADEIDALMAEHHLEESNLNSEIFEYNFQLVKKEDLIIDLNEKLRENESQRILFEHEKQNFQKRISDLTAIDEENKEQIQTQQQQNDCIAKIESDLKTKTDNNLQLENEKTEFLKIISDLETQNQDLSTNFAALESYIEQITSDPSLLQSPLRQNTSRSSRYPETPSVDRSSTNEVLE